MKTAILYKCNTVNDESIFRFMILKNAAVDMNYDIFWQYDTNVMQDPELMKLTPVENMVKFDPYEFKNNSDLNKYIYDSAEFKAMNWQLNLFSFVRHCTNDFDYIWLIDSNVVLFDDWSNFFKKFDSDQSDYISTPIGKYKDNANWKFWPLNLISEYADFLGNGYMCLNRTSKRYEQLLKKFYEDNNSEHNIWSECAYATTAALNDVSRTEIEIDTNEFNWKNLDAQHFNEMKSGHLYYSVSLSLKMSAKLNTIYGDWNGLEQRFSKHNPRKLKLLDNCYVISNNDEKLTLMYRWFDQADLPRPMLFQTSGGCDLSHCDLVKFAKNNNIPYITGFEDDAYPSNDVYTKLENVENVLELHWNDIGVIQLAHSTLLENGWGTQDKNTNEIYEIFFKNDRTWGGAWAMFVKADSYDERITSLTTPSLKFDFDYMKARNLSYNYADRLSQEFFTKDCLIVKDNVFEHNDIVKDIRLTFSATFSPIDCITIPVSYIEKYGFVISINDEQYDRFKKVFLHYSLPVPRRYDGFLLHLMRGWTKNGAKTVPNDCFGIVNCAATHISIVKLAKFLDWPYVFIFEDDAYPVKDIASRLQNYLTDIPDSIRLLTLGNVGFGGTGRTLCNRKYIKIEHNYGSHAYIVFKSGYDSYLNAAWSDNSVADAIIDHTTGSYSLDVFLFAQCNVQRSAISGNLGIWHTGYQLKELLQWFDNPNDFLK